MVLDDFRYFVLSYYAYLLRKENIRGVGIKKKIFRHVQPLVEKMWFDPFWFLLTGGNNPWFSTKEARDATQQRDALLKKLSGWVQYGTKGCKLYTFSLSPGCVMCQEGRWGCNFINRRCTRDCYFCKRYHSMNVERDPETEGFPFASPDEHINFLKLFQIKGVSFSGGEPLLVLERLLSHIRAIRKEFGNSLYVWMYTNGDLIERENLMRLKEAGLDEMRFNLSARDYDLSPVILAEHYIPTITVEIPAIPEDYDIVKSLLPELQAIGVKFLNLHQLSLEEENWKRLVKRDYHLCCHEGLSVYESEMCALRLFLHARERQLSLPMNYCSHAYKFRVRRRDARMRRALLSLDDFQEQTDSGFVRSLWVYDSPDKINDLLRRMEEAKCSSRLWMLHHDKIGIALHSSLRSYIDWSSATITIVYHNPTMTLKNKSDGLHRGNFNTNHEVVASVRGWGQFTCECWHKLYIQKENADDVFHFFYHHYPRVENRTARLQREVIELKELAQYEEFEEGMPEVF